MITTIFKKSTPINYILVALLMLVFFFLYQLSIEEGVMTQMKLIQKGILLIVLLASLFLCNFIVKKNNLTKDSSYTVLFLVLFYLFFPTVLNDFQLILANFFILLAMRKLISLQSLNMPKEKIFDASIWIFVATLFHFWCVLFSILIFVSILFHVYRDYRNWILPIIAFATVAVLFLFFSFLFNKNPILLVENTNSNFEIDYFTNNYQNLAFSLYATIVLVFLTSLLVTLSNRPLILNASYKKLIIWLLIGILIFIISPNKSNSLLIFTLAPIAIMTTIHLEITSLRWQREVISFMLIACSLFCFFSQL